MAKLSDVDRLYTLPLAEFTAARNALSKALRAAGEREQAERVKGLVKPSVGAWAVNQLYHRARRDFDRLLAAGAQQRRAVTRRGGVSAAAAESKRDALAELLRAAEGLLAKAGHAWTPALRQRVTRTLEALAAQAPGGAYRPGRLTVDLQPSGFDALLEESIVGSTPKRSARATRKAKPGKKRPSAAAVKRLEAARSRVQSTKSELAAARRKEKAAAGKSAGLERRAADAAKRARTAERRAERLRQDAAELELEARQAVSALERASRAVARLEARLGTETRKAEELA